MRKQTGNSRSVEVSATFKVSMQFLSDILVSMAETCPEIMVWFGDDNTDIERIADGETWLKPLSVLRIKGRYDSSKKEEGNRTLPGILDFAAVQLGLSRAITYPDIYDGLKGRILLALANDDCGQIDSEAADVIAQLALYGKVVYG